MTDPSEHPDVGGSRQSTDLEDIYKLKLSNVVTILCVVAVVLFASQAWISTWHGSLAWMRRIPLGDLAIAALSTAFLGIGYEFIVRRETDRRLQGLGRTIRAEVVSDVAVQVAGLASEVRQAETRVAAMKLSDPALLRDVIAHELSGPQVRSLIEMALDRLTGDATLARDAADALLTNVLSYKSRYSNYRVNMVLTDPDAENSAALSDYFVAHLEFRYRTSHYDGTPLKFARVANAEAYRELLADPWWEFVWLEEETAVNLAGSSLGLEVEWVSVDGHRLEVIDLPLPVPGRALQAQAKDGADSGAQGADIAYRFRVLIQKRAHLQFINLPVPSQGAMLSIDWAGVAIRHMNVYDFFDSPNSPSVSRYPSDHSSHRVEVSTNEWVFPKSGVVFGWVLEAEWSDAFAALLGLPDKHPVGGTDAV